MLWGKVWPAVGYWWLGFADDPGGRRSLTTGQLCSCLVSTRLLGKQVDALSRSAGCLLELRYLWVLQGPHTMSTTGVSQYSKQKTTGNHAVGSEDTSPRKDSHRWQSASANSWPSPQPSDKDHRETEPKTGPYTNEG